MSTCTFTGHRQLNDLDYALMDRVILNLVKNGCNRFFCGMAKGFDLAAAESLIEIKRVYPAEIVACIPCERQSDGYTAADRARYDRILKNCSEIIVLSDNYYNGCMQVRDRFMVDNSDVVLCYLRKKSGGTYYTVNYASKLGKKIIEI